MNLSSSGTGRVAVIDIGSNSIRLVVYDEAKRAAVPLYNEKVLCQLGKKLATTGKLHPEGIELAREALGRFLSLARNMQVGSLSVMATAAVRDAGDGSEFARSIEQEYGISVEIISGVREARLGALGICASIHQPSGVTGDLGGGSLEMVHLQNAKLVENSTLPIGSLRLLDEMKGDRGEMRKAIARALESAPWIKEAGPERFYAIGGSFRAIARLHMIESNYPLRILHQYTVSAREFADFAAMLAAMPDSKLEKLPGLPAKRVPTIPPASMVLAQALEKTGAKKIVFSASGIREGYLFEKLTESVQKQDVLLATCREIAERGGRSAAYAQELLSWMDPLFIGESEAERRLRTALSFISDMAHHIHPEYRAEWGMQRILASSFTGITHKERAQLALALYHRYQFKRKDGQAIIKLVDERARAWAQLAGTIANLAHHLTGSIPGSLNQVALSREGSAVTLAFARGHEALMGEAIKKRIGGVEEVWTKWREVAGKA